MPSWSTSEDSANGAATPPETEPPSEVESARRLLEELFTEPEPDDRPAPQD